MSDRPNVAWIDDVLEKIGAGVAARKIKHALFPPILGRETSPKSAREFVDRYFRVGQFGTVALARWRDEFYHWDGHRYRVIEDEELRARLYDYLETASVLKAPKLHAMKIEAPNGMVQEVLAVKKTERTVEIGGEVFEKAPFPAEREYVNKILDALGPQVLVSRDKEPPLWRAGLANETLWPAKEIVACRNGLLHMPSRQLISHSPSFFNLNVLNVDYDPAPPYPETWVRFLMELFGDDADSLSTLQEIMGYMISGDTSQEKIFLFQGARRGGKGTIARVLQALLGADNVDNSTISALAGEFGLQPLIGKTACVIEDAKFDGLHPAQMANVAGRLLTVSGRGAINVNRKGIGQWNGTLPARFLICSNQPPRFTDASSAITSRFVPLVFTRSFEGREDRELGKRLEPEYPAILNWALDGYARLCERGHFVIPASASGLIRDMGHYASTVQRFVEDKGYEIDPNLSVREEGLFTEYRQWCTAKGFPDISFGQFTLDLRAAYPQIQSGVQPRHDDRRRHYRGIGKRGVTPVTPVTG